MNSERIDSVGAVLEEKPVSFAMIFGSIARNNATEHSDIDIAVEFETICPGEDGYSDLFLETYNAVDEAVSVDVDLIDVYTMPPAFASFALEVGIILLGSEERRIELTEELAQKPSLEDAKRRVNDASQRLNDE
jgi:predicted nucleotidyltransferase